MLRSNLPSQLVVNFLSLLVTFVAAPAFAQTAAPAAGGPPAIMNLVPILVIIGVMYFMMIRPQAKRQKSHQEFLTKLKRGDEVLTSGGLLGRVEGLTDLFITLEIAPDVRIKVLRTQIMGSVPTAVTGSEVKA